MSAFTTRSIGNAAARIADHAEAVKDDLCAADAKLGDGDLGITVAAGWREIADNASGFPDDVGKAFLECAKCFQRASSSSYGTLVATGFMAAAKACKGRDAVPWSETAALISAALEATMTRGKGSLGDKSVLDVLAAAAQAAEGQESAEDVQAAVEAAAAETVAAFRDKPNKLGRARMFGEKSIGLDDPGQLAALEMIRALGKSS